MEERLEQYRSTVRRNEILNTIRRRIVNMVHFQSTAKGTKDETIVIPEANEDAGPDTIDLTQDTDASESISVSDTDDEQAQPVDTNEQCETSKFQYVIYLVWFCFWLTCWLIAIELQFGAVFFMFSGLFGIYFNTRTTPKTKHEVSAYSVFNKDCESIKGTLKPEQFEAEIRYGPMSVHH